jgi:chromate reductase
MSKHIVALSGSLREKSYNTSLLKAVASMAPDSVTIELLDIHEFPLFNEDLEKTFPEAVQKVKEKIAHADGIIISTPEYNRSISGVLKNAIDWISRPEGNNTFAGKPTIVMGASNGLNGTAIAQQDLKKIMLYLGTKLIPHPEFYMREAQHKFNEEGELTDEATKTYVMKSLQALIANL